MAAALLLNSRNEKMSRVQAINSVVLFAGHANKKVHTRLNRLGVCMSHKTATKRVKELAENHDEIVLKWKAKCEGVSATTRDSASASSNSASSDEESENEELLICTQSQDETPPSTPHGDRSPPSPPSPLSISKHLHRSVSSPAVTHVAPSYILVGDNWDKNIRPRHMTMEHQTTSLHLFHAYAVLDRVDCTGLSDDAPTADLKNMSPLSFMPSVEDCMKLRDDYITLVARIVVEKLPAFKLFAESVDKNIPHPYTAQMKEKSVVIPLGVIPSNENTREGMIEIMEQLHAYVPVAQSSGDTEEKRLKKVLLGGDQLTAARARTAQRACINSDLHTDAVHGLVPFASDWHAEFNLMEVIFKRLYKNESSQESGTLLQLHNLINRRNISRDISGNFNAALDFLSLVTTSHILAAAMHFFGMSSRNDVPTLNAIPLESLRKPTASQCRLFKDRMSQLVDRYIIAIEYNSLLLSQLPSPLRTMPTLSPAPGSNPHADRVTTEHSYAVPSQQQQQKKARSLPSFLNELGDEPHTSTVIKSKSPDGIFNYVSAVLNDGLLLMELRDAIHEGDGDRIMRAWKFMLVYLRFGRYTNYALEAFQLQTMVNATATPRVAHQLKWSRIVNVHGGTGRNIPVDLHNEHLNRMLKDSVGDMGANLSESAVVQRSKSLKGVMDIIHTFDLNTDIHTLSTDHTASSLNKDEDAVLMELIKSKVFDYIPGRKHKTFANISPNVSGHINASNFFQWLQEQKDKIVKYQELENMLLYQNF